RLRAPLVQPSRHRGAELQHPSPHRFVGDIEPSFGQQFLDIAVAQSEAEVQPDRMLDDLRWEAMAAVALSHPLGPRLRFRDNALRALWALRARRLSVGIPDCTCPATADLIVLITSNFSVAFRCIFQIL